MALYPSKVLRAKERGLIPYSSVIFCLGLTFGIPQGVRSVSGMSTLSIFHYEEFVNMRMNLRFIFSRNYHMRFT
jgi:hypothetical protein